MLYKSEAKTSLYQLYYDFFNVYSQEDKEKADLFASTMEELFVSIGEHNLTTLCMNLDDGIGDYVSQVYFIEKLDQLFQDVANVHLKNISLVSKGKLPIAKIVRETKIHEEEVVVLEKHSDENDINQKKNIIGIPTPEQKLAIDQLLNHSDFIFNLALSLKKDPDKLVLGKGYKTTPCHYEIDYNSLKRDAMLASWLEYNFKSKRYLAPQIPQYGGPIFSEVTMGINSESVGIRFIDSISAMADMDKGDILRLFSKEIRKRLGITVDSDEYVENNSFVGGYLQDKTASYGFVQLACQTTPKKGDMNALVNMAHFASIETDRKFLDAISVAGFTHIVLPDQVICLSDDPLLKNKRSLRLFEFKGISSEDKDRFYRLSEMIAASGDTSVSETITAGLIDKNRPGNLPFFQPFLTKDNPIDALLPELPYKIKPLSDIQPEPGSLYLQEFVGIKYRFVLEDGTILEGRIEAGDLEFSTRYLSDDQLLTPKYTEQILDYLAKNTELDVRNFKLYSFAKINMKYQTVYAECTDSGVICAFFSPSGEEIKEIISWEDLPPSFPRKTSAMFDDKNTFFPILLNALAEKKLLRPFKLLDTKDGEPIENYYQLKKFLQICKRKVRMDFEDPSGGRMVVRFSEDDIKTIRENRAAIASAWQSFCQYLNKQRNERNYFNQLIATYTFHHLLKHNRIDEVLRLAKMIKPDSLSEPLLHMAIRLNNLDAVKAILEAGLTDINQPHSSYEFTPLHFAVHYNNPRMVMLLLENKADITRLNSDELSALDLAKRKGFKGVIDVFEAFEVANEQAALTAAQIDPAPKDEDEPNEEDLIQGKEIPIPLKISLNSKEQAESMDSCFLINLVSQADPDTVLNFSLCLLALVVSIVVIAIALSTWGSVAAGIALAVGISGVCASGTGLGLTGCSFFSHKIDTPLLVVANEVKQSRIVL